MKLIDLLDSRLVQYALFLMFLTTLIHFGIPFWAALVLMGLNQCLFYFLLGFIRAWIEDDDDDDDDDDSGIPEYVPSYLRGVAR